MIIAKAWQFTKNVIDSPNDPNQTGTVIHCINFKAPALHQLFAVVANREIIKLKSQNHQAHNTSNYSCGSNVIATF